MVSEHDPVNWIIPEGSAYTTIVFLESTVNLDGYLAIYRITNTSELDVIIGTLAGNNFILSGQQADAQPASIDVSSTQITIGHEGRFYRGKPLTGTYQLLCCSVGRTADHAPVRFRKTTEKIKPAKHGGTKRKPIEKAD
jgi:hypothetical protein